MKIVHPILLVTLALAANGCASDRSASDDAAYDANPPPPHHVLVPRSRDNHEVSEPVDDTAQPGSP